MMYIFLLIWIVSGFIAAGFDYAYFQREYPYLAKEQRAQDTRDAWLCLLCGPAAFLACVMMGNTQHGWLFPGSDPFK